MGGFGKALGMVCEGFGKDLGAFGPASRPANYINKMLTPDHPHQDRHSESFEIRSPWFCKGTLVTLVNGTRPLTKHYMHTILQIVISNPGYRIRSF